MAASIVNMENVKKLLEESLSKLGFEIHTLKVGWYNSVLTPKLHLPYPDDCLAIVVLSTPSMFEQAFLPFMEERGCQGVSDPIDQCVKHCVTSAVSQCFPGQKVDMRYDYELLPSRKPKFLAQTAAHVSGAAFYYQQTDVADHPWQNKKLYGVCIHPRLGGWFAIRALLVFEDVKVDSDVVQPAPPDCVPSREDRIHLLEAFNFNWQDWNYRNIITPTQTYSQKQRDYFVTPPAKRHTLLRSWGFLPKSDEPSAPGCSSGEFSQMNGHG
uniref:cyanocobalamin reductase / alkylcobalamin dealkylase n=1 Tax=Doryrhamphus excisus TaxID=161450 RepID=UPI0025AE5F5C|nr:cyanocobalamin reductase / alkylcobalamin dealkylase [Doryrhamphus excisus]